MQSRTLTNFNDKSFDEAESSFDRFLDFKTQTELAF